jgi:hypothetical protein
LQASISAQPQEIEELGFFMETIRQEIIFLTCDDQEFRRWVELTYADPKYDWMPRYRQNSQTFSFMLSIYTLVFGGYAFELGKHKFIFELKGSRSEPIEFELFLSAVRNKFTLPQIDQVTSFPPPTQPNGKIQKRRDEVRKLFLGGNHFYTREQIAQRCGVSLRTINRDLKDMKLTRKNGSF